VLECLPRQGRICIRQFCYPLDVVDAVDVLRYSRSGNVPIVVFDLVEVDESDRNVPVFAFGRVG
jgi:hypothetical protein